MTVNTRAIFAIFAFLALAACGNDADGRAESNSEPAFERRSDSFLADYEASLSDQPPAKAIDASGDWYGLLLCPSGSFPISIAVQQNGASVEGVASISPAIGKPRRKTPFYAEHTDRRGSGEYRAPIQMFNIDAQPNPEEDPRKARGLSVSLLLSPSEGDTALLAAYEISAARSQRKCELGIAARDGAAEQLKQHVQRIATIHADRRPVTQGECPAAYREWLDGMAPDGSLPFTGDDFERAFGKAYLEMDVEELLAASSVISGSCRDREDRKQRTHVARIGGQLRNHSVYQSALVDQWREGVWDTWRTWIDSELARGASYDMTNAVALRSVPRLFGMRKHPTFKQFDGRAAELVEQGKTGNRNLDFAKRIEYRKDDFRELLALHLQASGRQDVDIGMVRTALDYYLATAAEQYASSAKEAPEAVFMFAWRAQHAAGAECPAASSNSCEQVAEHFGDRLEDLAESFADEEQDAYAALPNSGDDLERLATLITFERQLRSTYGELLQDAVFADSNDERLKDRLELQDDAQEALLEQIDQTDTAPGLRALQARYFVDDELQVDDVEDVKEAFAARLADTEPFADIAGAEYFNALFNRDYVALRRLDNRYLQGVRPLIALGTQQAVTMGPLIDAITGKTPGSSASEIRAAMQNLSVVYAVLGTYLVDYQDVYSKCLKPNARSVTISQRTDLVTRDGFGNEIRRSEGWTTRDTYKVNPEFRNHFQALFDTATGTAQAQLLDLFLNDARVANLRNGTRQLMRSYACDSPQVKQLEKGLIAYDRELKRRASRR